MSAGRDPGRERRIVEAMAERAPSLGPDRLAPIVNAIIEAGLDAAETRR
jgi:chorismate mutase